MRLWRLLRLSDAQSGGAKEREKAGCVHLAHGRYQPAGESDTASLQQPVPLRSIHFPPPPPTYQDVAEHNTKKDIYVVIHDKIYDCTQFVDEHPGGEEVLLDCAGQDATEAFEDVGHSDEARETLDKIQVGVLKRQPGDPAPKAAAQPTSHSTTATSYSSNDNTGFGVGLYAILLIGGALGYYVFYYMAQQDKARKV
ncbi:Cytochrome b5 [Moelleriella libera RCEF 2490]|uniref:Cytochrome b5 n=1 Tax=Moelleriella libera RCEF 2490 TaxID=1081109 RepID=A0A162IPA4_9HYPO|nr:Cytochrome b5 [Moelleriella libera RCEF 2490]